MNKKPINEVLIDNSNQHEAISFSISVIENRRMLELTFIPNTDKVYRTSDYKKVLYPPNRINLELDEYNLLMLCSCLISSISLNFKEERLEIFGNEFITTRYIVKIRKIYKEENRNKIIFDIFSIVDNKQIISFSLSKTKIILLLFLIRDSFIKIDENFSFLVASNTFLFNISKGKNNSLGINGIWLRNSEIEILRYIANSIIFDFQFKSKFEGYKKIHRQLLIYKKDDKEIICSIKKLDNPTNNLHFTLNSQVVAALYLSNSQYLPLGDEEDE
ncbi:hypothetical protein ACNSOL_11890 (plasmid) [Aliarcobacter lanthieri]|uniref:hypothetical protein n=1 Tax=Aliarcobacter lanthieri TaxID=1355374 RepID=UPI003AB06C94